VTAPARSVIGDQNVSGVTVTSGKRALGVEVHPGSGGGAGAGEDVGRASQKKARGRCG